MNINRNEFRKYAVKHQRIGSQYVDRYLNRPINLPKNMTPYITEERQLNVAQMDVFSRLMMDRIIFLGEPVADRMANIIQAQLLFLQSVDAKKDIQLYINSPGGDVYSGMGIYDTMQLITPDVGTICIGMAFSMSAVLLCAGKAGKRAALQHSRVMIHQPSGGVQGVSADIEITAKQVVKVRQDLYSIIAKHSGQSYDWVHRASDRDYWMNGAEAKEHGIIDEVLGDTD
ncbi:ATP-dependent Clp protease proteolytic subunit [Pedobacter sp. Leaf216]|uniref:ATP-dependent Clp protease proteolytic subunit n=1 Tax=Pedobacter sp. Leaf216 TaxID=1735684 RepID=UPI0006F833F9|nr:ATP-dependent Clp protease proteolytic subunit [Pedobacter sp. Leaf216]KQM69322.1 ATP-dependent Clp protease proteolytic subunit [Pedobacter sp. Leaf216]